MVDGACVGDGVGDFDFVGPPVGEDGGADGVFFDDLGDLVGFEAMLEGADCKIELFGEAAEHEDFVLAVGMGVDEAVACEDLGEGFEFEVAGWDELWVLDGVFEVGVGFDRNIIVL